MPKVFVIIHSMWGHIKTLADSVVEGLKELGVGIRQRERNAFIRDRDLNFNARKTAWVIHFATLISANLKITTFFFLSISFPPMSKS
jgi:hypothetical protein